MTEPRQIYGRRIALFSTLNLLDQHRSGRDMADCITSCYYPHNLKLMRKLLFIIDKGTTKDKRRERLLIVDREREHYYMSLTTLLHYMSLTTLLHYMSLTGFTAKWVAHTAT